MSSCFPVRLARRALAAPQPLVKISRVIPPASAAIPARVSSARSVVGAIEIAAAVAARTAVEAVPTVVQTAGARAAQDSNAVRAVPVAPATIAVIAAIPVRRAVRSSSLKC